MITRPKDLPNFAQPPVTEVVLSVQFDELDSLQMIDARSVWEQFGTGDFPQVQEHPALPPTFETFGGPQTQRMPRIELVTSAMWPRFWFMKSDESELIQFQRDRLIHNWRKLDPSWDYPRYEPLRQSFERELIALQGFLHTRDSELKTNQCEISYINTISCPDEWAEPFAKVFRHWSSIGSEITGLPESSTFLSQHVIADEDGTPAARLFIQAAEGRTVENVRTINLSLTVRGKPKSAEFSDILLFMDVGRNKIVKGFADITTSEMHEIWGVVKS